jgi:hypothetical protein
MRQNFSRQAQNGRKEKTMGKTKTRTAPVPKEIRQEVKTILQQAAKQNGIRQAAILFIDDKGELRGKGSGSDVFNQVVQQAVDNFTLIRLTAGDAFHQGWSMAERVQQAN